MKDPIMKAFLLSTLLLITLILIADVAFSGEKSEWLNKNPCMIKIVITSVEKGDTTVVTKEEVMKCKDGYDGPNYWELFAAHYYSNLTVPAYCRKVARPDHPFKMPGLMCLDEHGVWETK